MSSIPIEQVRSIETGRRSASDSAVLPSPSPWAYYLPVTLLVLIFMALQSIFAGVPVFPVDDAYITIHNAQVLHWGHDPNFSGTSALAGATSPFHLALVALLMFFLSPVYALNVAAWLGALAFALGTVHLARRHGMTPLPAFLLAVTGLLAARTPHQLMNGLETGWALAGVTWTLALASEKETCPAFVFGGLCGTLPFLRPELAALSLLLLPLPAWRQWRSTGRVRDSLVLLGQCMTAALSAAAPWLIWQFSATGGLIPATIAAKRYYFAEADLPAAIKRAFVETKFTAFLMSCGPLAFAALCLPFTRVGRAGIGFAAVLLYAYYRQFPGALSHYEGRYLYILLPLLLFGVASAFRLLSRWPAPQRWVNLFVLIAAFQTILVAPALWRDHRAAQKFTQSELAGVAAWCRANLPPGSRLLIHDAGYISYATRFPMNDIVGLKTPQNIAFHESLTNETGGKLRGAAINAIAARAQPDYLVVLEDWDSIYRITDGLRRAGWNLEPVRKDGSYRVYRITRRDERSARSDVNLPQRLP